MSRAPAPPEGFAEFVAPRSPALPRAAWLLTGDAGRAEDLLQTALARSRPHWDRIARGDSPEGYVRSWWRRRWRAELPTGELPDRAGPGDVAAGSAARDGLRHAPARLTPRQRAVVVLRHVEDRTVAETAELQGCSPGTVKTLAFRALETLRADTAVRALLTAEGAER